MWGISIHWTDDLGGHIYQKASWASQQATPLHDLYSTFCLEAPVLIGPCPWWLDYHLEVWDEISPFLPMLLLVKVFIKPIVSKLRQCMHSYDDCSWGSCKHCRLIRQNKQIYKQTCSELSGSERFFTSLSCLCFWAATEAVEHGEQDRSTPNVA